jgi:hypothetical protein
MITKPTFEGLGGEEELEGEAKVPASQSGGPKQKPGGKGVKFEEVINAHDLERARRVWAGDGTLVHSPELLDPKEEEQITLCLDPKNKKVSPRGQIVAAERVWQLGLVDRVLAKRDQFLEQWNRLNPDVRAALRSVLVPDWTPNPEDPDARPWDDSQLPLQGDRAWDRLAELGLEQLVRLRRGADQGGPSHISPEEIARRQAERAAREAKRAAKREEDKRKRALRKGTGGGPQQGKGGQKKGKKR